MPKYETNILITPEQFITFCADTLAAKKEARRLLRTHGQRWVKYSGNIWYASGNMRRLIARYDSKAR